VRVSQRKKRSLRRPEITPEKALEIKKADQRFIRAVKPGPGFLRKLKFSELKRAYHEGRDCALSARVSRNPYIPPIYDNGSCLWSLYNMGYNANYPAVILDGPNQMSLFPEEKP
jgi:hypothetical protein